MLENIENFMRVSRVVGCPLSGPLRNGQRVAKIDVRVCCRQRYVQLYAFKKYVLCGLAGKVLLMENQVWQVIINVTSQFL